MDKKLPSSSLTNPIRVETRKVSKEAKDFLNRKLFGSARDLERIAEDLKETIGEEGLVRFRAKQKKWKDKPPITDTQRFLLLFSEADLKSNGWVRVQCAACDASALGGVFKERQSKTCSECGGCGFRWGKLFTGLVEKTGVEEVFVDGKIVPYADFIQGKR